MALTRLGIGRITDFTDTSEVAQVLSDQYQSMKEELLADHPWSFATRRDVGHHYLLDKTLIDATGNTIDPPGDEWPFEDFVGKINFKIYDPAASLIVGGVELALPSFGAGEQDDKFYIRKNTLGDGLGWFLVNEDEGRFSTTVTTISAAPATGTYVYIVYSPEGEWDYAHLLPSDFLRVVDIGDRDEIGTYEWEVQDQFIMHNYGADLRWRYVRNVEMSDIKAPLFKKALSLKIAVDLAETGIKTTSVEDSIKQDYSVALQRAKSVDSQQSSPVPQENSSWAQEMGIES